MQIRSDIKLKIKLHTLILILVWAASLTAGQSEKSKSPDWVLPLIIEKGAPIHSKDLDQKIYLLDFWASWCLPCRESLPALEKIQKKYPNLIVIAVSLDNDLNNAKWFNKKYAPSLVAYWDHGAKLAEFYQIKGLPTLLLVGKNHHIQYRIDGYNGELTSVLEEPLSRLMTDNVKVKP